MQPVRASSAYTVPFWLPTNTRPPATVGCDHATEASGNPKAHFSASLGRSAAVSPASAAGLRTRVRDRRTPARPARCACARGRRLVGGGAAAGVGAAHVAGDRPAGEVFGDRATLGARQARALRAHRAVDEALDDRLRRARPQRVGSRRARVGRAGVAARAALREHRGAVGRLRRCARGHEQRARPAAARASGRASHARRSVASAPAAEPAALESTTSAVTLAANSPAID